MAGSKLAGLSIFDGLSGKRVPAEGGTRPDQGSAAKASATEGASKEGSWEKQWERDDVVRSKRLNREKEIAEQGEIAWVRSGGVLRDPVTLRRDKVRTAKILEEIRLQEEERRLLNQWEDYERRWQALLVSTGPLCFSDIPWPSASRLDSVQDLTPTIIAEFLLASLRVRSNTISKKDRIRASFLRWHPDKLSSVLRRVQKDDEDVVREGISAVLLCLQELQAAEKSRLN